MTLERRLFLLIRRAGVIRSADIKGFPGSRHNTLCRLVGKGLIVREGSGPWTWAYRIADGAQPPENYTGTAPGSIAVLVEHNRRRRMYRPRTVKALPSLSWDALL
jgi:hypothetical protein